MLTKIVTKNYRNLDLEDGVTLGPLNIFVGPNGSGKSNLIKVLKFIQDGLIGAPDPRRGVTSFESAIADFGSGRILDATVRPPALVSMALSYDLEFGYEHVFDVNLDISNQSSVQINRERILRHDVNDPSMQEVYYRTYTSPGTGYTIELPLTSTTVSYFDVAGSFRNDFVVHNLTHVAEAIRAESDIDITSLTKGIRLLTEQLSGWGFYESARMDVEAIRHPRLEIGAIDQTLNPSGNNLIPVLSNLFRDHIDFEERMLDAMQELFQQTRRLRVVPEGRTLAIQWFVNGIDEPFYIDQMSTGTVRMLCWATVLLSPKKHGLIVIEEPESDIHPAWLRVLAGWIRQAARESQVIISTHSPDLLDYFTDDADSVRVFKRSPKNPKNSTIVPLDRNALAPRLQEGWQLGDLYRVHDPSVGGWPW